MAEIINSILPLFLKEYTRLVVVAGVARAVRAGAVAHPEHTGLVKIILHAADWQALADALDALDNNQGRCSQVQRRMTNDELLVE